MPASVYEPIASVLKNSFHGHDGAKSSSLGSKMNSTLQKSLLVPVHFDDPIKQTPSLTPKQKAKYTVLNPKSEVSETTSVTNGAAPGHSSGSNTNRFEQIPEPKLTLFRREQVELGYRNPAGPGAGMFNMGNTCYLNSTLQALFHTPAFVNYLRNGGHENSCSSSGFSSCTICIMATTLRGTTNANVMKPIKIYEKLKLICKHLTHGRQEDAHEFLRYLVESLQKSYLISRKIPKSIDNYTKETTPFNQIFGGYMRQDVVCMRCKHVSTTFQHFMDLLLDIRQADNIEAALGGYFRRESLGQGENMYKCEKCKQKVPATKQYRIERPPLVLCIQLKRFNLLGGKNGRPVTLAKRLNISSHVRWAQHLNHPIEYQLVSMINHVGPSPNCGHYTSIGQAANGAFYRFDDASVNPTSLQNALNTPAYVVFYEMLKSSKEVILSQKSKVTSSSPKIQAQKASPENKFIGPQLPNNNKVLDSPKSLPSSNPVPKPSPSPKMIQEPPKVKSSIVPQIKPKMISEPSSKLGVKISPKPPPEPVKVLVPYDNASSSDEETVNLTPKKPLVINTQTTSKTQSASISSPFLPRAVAANIKKSKEVCKSENSLKNDALNPDTNKSVTEVNSLKSSISVSEPEKPNRDPSSEALYSKNPNSTAREEALKTIAPSTPQSKNDFVVKDLDSHNPSVHSDNSTGSTASFTISDINPAARGSSSSSSDISVTSRQKWNVTSLSRAESLTKKSGHSNGNSVKRERSVPPKLLSCEKVRDSNEDIIGSPEKRKKLLIPDHGTLLDRAAEIGKDVWNAGTKLGKQFFKGKLGKEIVDTSDIPAESSTVCEATTSHQDEKPISSSSSSRIEKEVDEDKHNSSDFCHAKKHKKKKKKHKRKYEDGSDNEDWVEKTKDNLNKFNGEGDNGSNTKVSAFNPDAPIKQWNSKPDMKSIGRSVTWDGSRGSNIADEVMKSTSIRSWSGDRSSLDKRPLGDQRKRSAADELDAEMDAGRVKKMKKHRIEPPNFKWDKNPFQIAQNIANRGESERSYKSHDSDRWEDKKSKSWNRDDHHFSNRDHRGYSHKDHHKKDKYDRSDRSSGNRDWFKKGTSHHHRR